MVTMYLEAGVEVNAKADKSWTALMLAQKQSHAKIIRLLVEAVAMGDNPIGPVPIPEVEFGKNLLIKVSGML